MSWAQHLDLLDWKRRVFTLYEEIRGTEDPSAAWALWKKTRDGMFAGHPQSPVPEPERRRFRGLSVYDYDPTYRALAEVTEAEPAHFEISTSGTDTMSFSRVGVASFMVAGVLAELELYWLHGYGGGLFVPFRDATSENETYGAGRYVLDTVKGADLGLQDGRLVLDFNFAYNPSCAYDPRWVCPLAPPPNRLDVPVRAGERLAS